MTKKSDQEYKQSLSDIQYRVTREAATERPFTGEYWDHWGNGRYSCICCGTPSFNHQASLMLGVVGLVITSPKIVMSLPKSKIARMGWSVPRCVVANAMLTLAMSLKMGHNLQACVTALIPPL